MSIKPMKEGEIGNLYPVYQIEQFLLMINLDDDQEYFIVEPVNHDLLDIIVHIDNEDIDEIELWDKADD